MSAKIIQINKRSSCSTATFTVEFLVTRGKKFSYHEENLTNYEFYQKKMTNPFDKPNHNVTILSHYGKLHCQGNRTVETSGQYLVTILLHCDFAYQMGLSILGVKFIVR